jgi:hypothetical protein
MPGRRRQQRTVSDRVIGPGKLHEGVAEPLRIVEVIQSGAEEVRSVVVALPDPKASLGRTAPGGVDRRVRGLV